MAKVKTEKHYRIKLVMDFLYFAACGTGCTECTSDASDVVTCIECSQTYYVDQGVCNCECDAAENKKKQTKKPNIQMFE